MSCDCDVDPVISIHTLDAPRHRVLGSVFSVQNMLAPLKEGGTYILSLGFFPIFFQVFSVKCLKTLALGRPTRALKLRNVFSRLCHAFLIPLPSGVLFFLQAAPQSSSSKSLLPLHPQKYAVDVSVITNQTVFSLLSLSCFFQPLCCPHFSPAVLKLLLASEIVCT